MIDYSFLRLKEDLTSALDIKDPRVTTHYYYNPIQLLPDLTYLQITNVKGGISLSSDCEVYVIDCCDNVKADITNNVFIEEFTDNNGDNQCKIEFVNLGVDFYRNTVLIKFRLLTSDAVFYTNPLNITSYQKERTVYFKYKNYDDYSGIGYSNANVYQSISLAIYFDIPIDETETEDYFQISRNNTISARALEKVFEQYKIEQINRFTFVRLNKLLKHEVIYLDDVRVTNKPVVSSSERFGDSNVFETDFIVAKDYNDVSKYEFQIFTGLVISDYDPFDIYLTGYIIDGMSFDGNLPLTLNTGTVSVYDENNILIDSFNESVMLIQNTNQLKVIVDSSSPVNSLPNGKYYVKVTEGLVSGLGIPNQAINDTNTWYFELLQGRYDVTRYSANDYLTGQPTIESFLSVFYKFNETSGSVAVDDSGNGLDGNIVNAQIDETGLVDKAYLFNANGATNEYIDIPNNNLLSFTGSNADTPFSISLWVNPQSNFGAILNKYNANDGYEYRLFMQSGVLQFFIYSQNNTLDRIGIADNSLIQNQFNHIAITWDGNTMKMKVNNNISSFTQTEVGSYVKMTPSSSVVRIAQESDSDNGLNRFQGKIDILKIYKNYVLSDSEIELEYNNGNGTEL